MDDSVLEHLDNDEAVDRALEEARGPTENTPFEVEPEIEVEREIKPWPGRYNVTVEAKEVFGYKDVRLILFHEDMPKAEEDRLLRECGWTELPEFPDDRAYVRTVVAETFSEAESMALIDYLVDETTDVKVEPADMNQCGPGSSFIGVSVIPLGGGQDVYMFDETDDYSLPFAVRGFFDVRGCKRTDAKVIGDWVDSVIEDTHERPDLRRAIAAKLLERADEEWWESHIP